MEPAEASKPRVIARRRDPGVRIALWTSVTVGLIPIGLFIGSFFLDGFLRPRLEARMNAILNGYYVSLGHTHFQPLNLRLTLERLIVVQDAHPSPPVAEFPLIRFHVHWAALLSGHVLATAGIWNPELKVNLPQLDSEVRSKTPLRERGWQDALESVYPFKINRLAIHDGDIVYTDTHDARPLHLANLNFVTDNIKNTDDPNKVYPSDFSGSMTVFGSGRLTVNGRANYLMKPYPGVVTNYVLKGAPLWRSYSGQPAHQRPDEGRHLVERWHH
jgi:hypothetical protein